MLSLEVDLKNNTEKGPNLIQDIQDQLSDSKWYWFFLSIVLAQIWVIYLTFYNSRVVGLILTAVINRFTNFGHIRLGSLSFSVLSGKIMFRDVHLITEDFTMRIQNGWIIFKWWRPFIPKTIKEDLSHMECRVAIFLDDLEVHIYNRSVNYSNLEKLFSGKLDKEDEVQNDSKDNNQEGEKKRSVSKKEFMWRDLIPVIKVQINSGRVVFGNHLVPNSMIVKFDDGNFTYTTKPASTPFDILMHDAKGKAENFKIMFVPSPKYHGPVDEPPRNMGEGFVVLQTRNINVHLFMDEPGTVPYEPESVQLADGETVVLRTYPCFGVVAGCGKNTDFNYGPWADRQRELLWKFFYPADYQAMVPTIEPKPGELRQYKTFEFRMNMYHRSTIDILFTKNAETQAIHMNANPGSYIEMNIPWMIAEDGYVTTVKGQFLLADASTSLQYRSLIECETFEFTVTASYPLTWNDHQDWVCDFIACKATVFLIFHLKHFFKDLMEDWSSEERQDIFHFVPYTWTINLIIKEFELVLLTNEYNWIDTTSTQTENAHIAFAGQTLDLSLVLPYTDYLPSTVHIGLVIKGENAYCRFYLPESNTSRQIVLALSKNMKIMDRNGKIIEKPFKPEKRQWRRFTEESEGWIDCWTTTHVAISLGYTYHPMPLLEDKVETGEVSTKKKKSAPTTPIIEEEINIPMGPFSGKVIRTDPPDGFDPANMEPDLIALELEVAPSMLCIYGSLLRNFLHVKENYLGEDQVFTDFYDTPKEKKLGEAADGPYVAEAEVRPFDEREYRPFAVTVSLVINDIHGHLVKNCNIDDLPCPSIFLERLCFEMDKTYLETKLQLLLSPAVLVAKDTYPREDDNKHLNEGHLGLSGLQVRGHAMFSHEGLPMESETLEYAWLIEVVIGDLTGKLTSPQLQNLVEFIQTFIILVEDPENCLQPSKPNKLCQHMLPQPQCRMLPQYSYHCPLSEDIKYEMVRLSVDSISFFLVESGTALNLQVHPIKLSTCNLHGTNTRAGITARVEHISLTQFISSSALKHDSSQLDLWFESGGLTIGPIDGEAAMALPNPDFHKIQDNFLKIHDKKTRRLWFLWPPEEIKVLPLVIGKCGCLGGCAFFGNNRTGIGFFNSKKCKERPFSAVLKVSPAGQDPGFGQSLLFKDKLVFEVSLTNGIEGASPSKGNGFKFTRGYMSNVTTPESGTNITIIGEKSSLSQSLKVPKESLFQESPGKIQSQISIGDAYLKSAASDSILETKPSLSSNISSKSPEDISSSSPSDSKSLSSRKESLENFSKRDSSGNRRVGLADSLTTLKSINRKSGSDLDDFKMSERSFSKSSLSTPKVLRQGMGSKVQSEMSIESERYYSADEDMEISQPDICDNGISFLSTDNMSLDGTLKRHDSTVNDQTVIQLDTIKRDKKPIERQLSSESSGSTLSYESATTEPNDADSFSGVPENFLVDLHGQVQKPISESPVLMSCYSSHLTHYQCNDWSQASPEMSYNKTNIADQSTYSLSSVGQSVQYVHSPACVPRFVKTRQGFSPSLMKTREEYRTEERDEDEVDDVNESQDNADSSILEEDPDNSLPENASITTAVVKVRGSMNVMLTPLFLESFQRYTEAVIPTLTALHPSSIIDGLHSQCVDSLKRQNRLKKVKEKSDSEVTKMPERQFSTESRRSSGEMKTKSIQALFTLSKINICVLQSGMVEEVIAFSAMESIRDLTCFSLLAVCFDNINCQLLSNSHSVKTMQEKPNPGGVPIKTSPKKQNVKRMDSSNFDKSQEDLVTEVCREEDVGTLHISRVHIQLQRLLKNSNYSDQVLLTAIPDHKSKVLFEFDKELSKPLAFAFPASPRQRGERPSTSTPSPKVVRRNSSRESRRSMSRQASRDTDSHGGTLPKLFRQSSIDEESLDGSPYDGKSRKVPSREHSFKSGKSALGFIMFECGLENIDVKAVRRLGFSENVDEQFTQKMEKVAKKLSNIQTSTRLELERELGKSEEEPNLSSSKHNRGNKKDSDSVHSWDSRVSLPSSSSSLMSFTEYEALKGDASSGMLEIKTIWFNFAAPPPISIKRKVDFTKHDWNLLSTGTPAINAWMNPLDRLICSVKHMMLTLTHRTSSVMACIMTDGLEESSVHFPSKSKYYKMTPLARILVEEPSCQLFTVLRKYLYKVGTKPVERAVQADTLPQLITIQKGILALTRQWKNVLYMPQLSEMDFKSQKTVRPYTVKFALPLGDDENSDDDECGDNMSEENFDVVDERVSLLTGDDGSIHKSGSISSFHVRGKKDHEGSSSMPSVQYKKLKSYLQGGLSQNSGANESPDRQVTGSSATPNPLLAPHQSLHRNDSNYSFHSAAASLTSMDKSDMTPPATPMKTEFSKSILKNNANVDKTQDLYQWMAKQEEFDFDDSHLFKRQDSLLGAFGSAWSQDDSRLDLSDEQFSKATSIMQLADARSLFKPFLQSIGLHVEGVRPTAMMKKFGGSLSLQGQLETIKIQIVSSERYHRRKEKSKKRKLIDFNAVPAFLCEGFLAHIAMKDVVDFDNKESGGSEDKNNGKPPLNFAMHKLEAKPTTLQVNFMMNCESVTQHVDMPLLRLVHQFVTMADNIKDTKKELKHSHSNLEWVKTHRKQDSKGSTSSADTQHSDISHSGLASPPSVENLSKMKDSTSSSESGPGQITIEIPPSHRKTSALACLPLNFQRPEQKRPDKHMTLSLKRTNIFQTKKTSKSDPIPIPNVQSKSSELLTPPQSLNYSDSVTIDMEDTSSPIVAEKTIVDEIKESTPKCWRTLYHLLELYSTMPETKTILGRRPTVAKLLPVIVEEPEGGSRERVGGSREPVAGNIGTLSGSTKLKNKSKQDINDIEEKEIGGTGEGTSKKPPHPAFSRTSFRQSIYVGESITLVVFGIAKVERVRMQALLSGLKLEAEMKSVHASGSYKEKAKGFLHRKSSESSVTAHIGNTNIVLLEGLPPDIKTVVTVRIDRSLGLHTTILRRAKEHNSAMVSIGAIHVDIPQHPVVLHGMVTRSSRELSTTLQEFRRPMSRAGRVLETMYESGIPENQQKAEKQKSTTKPVKRESTNKPTFLHIHIKAILQGITVGASLLPSLKAQYKTNSITVSGIAGKKAHFTLDLPSHALSFKSKVMTTETSIPSSASIDLPPIHMYADYRSYNSNTGTSESLTDGLVWREGSYLNGVAEVGMLEHSLSTDLLNHLVFVQKVFMKEVNELVQKVSGSDQPVPLWVDEIEPDPTSQPVLYSLLFRFKGIQITATTPTSSAVRLETGSVDLEISNRVQMAKSEDSPSIPTTSNNQKMFIKAQVDLNVALGQLLKNALFEEAEPEFQTMAFFKTKIAIRNALQDEMIPGVSADQEALLITLTRPIILIQPLAFDKAVLVWLNYKNAYEYWTEQRMALNTEVQTATRQVIGRIPQFNTTAPSTFSTLYLQVTVDDMGICVPVESVQSQNTHTSRFIDSEPGVALVMTLKSTQISACSSGSLVSKGKFQDFCLRFANDFETSWDDWKPDSKEDPIMNACVVPEGTYEVCSRTINKQASDPHGNAKWILNVQWEMKGIDVHLDTNIGKRLSSLAATLTALAGEPEDEMGEDEEGGQDIFSPNEYETEPSPRRPSLMLESLPSFVYDTSMDPKQRFRLIEKEMNEQARIVQDLRQLGASLPTIELEARKLEELKSIVFRDFRREILFKLKKQGESRTSALKDQLGIGNKPLHSRSKSYGGGHHRRSQADMDKLAAYNQQSRRIGSLDISKTLPARVKFGQTISTAYTPPGTPTSLTEDPSLLKDFSSSSLSPEARAWYSRDSTTSTDSSDISEEEGPIKSEVFSDDTSSEEEDIISPVTNPSIGSGGSKTTMEPNIDFELDIKVFIDSGKCVLHPKDSKEDELKRQQKREKTPTPSQSSPKSARRNPNTPDFGQFSGQNKKQGQQQPPQVENTVFFMPSVDVKVHYNSKTSNGIIESAYSPESVRDLLPQEDAHTEEEVVVIRRPKSNQFVSPTTSTASDCTDSNISLRQKPGVKKAKLYAWLSLQSLPEEMIISPYLMYFLEQALEPIPIGQPGQTASPPIKKMDPFSMLNIDLDASSTSLTTGAYYSSFPVDVVVFIRVEPSIIRFNCVPVSRVECLLQVPSLDVVFSTRGPDMEAQIGEASPPLKTKVSRERNWSGGKYEKSRTHSNTSSSNDLPVMSKAGGLSFTGRLSDFSLYIFHPYGGAQRKMTSPMYSSDSAYKLGSIQEHGTAWSEMSRRDMLSLNVEFIKVTISRSRKLEVRLDQPSQIHVSKHEPQSRSNVVRFSAVCDIGTAAFKYDMRRLSEILTFPKAWYNRNLTRRLFLGEESFAQTGDEEWDSSSSSSMGEAGSFSPPSKIFTSSPALNVNGGDIKTRKTHHRRGSSGDKFRTQLSMELKNEIDSRVNRRGSMSAPQSPTDISFSESGSVSTHRSLSKQRASLTPSETPRSKRRASGATVTKPSSSWETLVMFAVNLSQLDLRVQMSNVMGNTVWSTKNVKSQGRLSIDCSGHKDLKITTGMDNSHFDSKGGVVGGTLEINNLSTFVEVNEDPIIGKEPSHRLGLSLFAIECRMDYMGTSVLMTRLSKLDIEIKDEWHVEDKSESDGPLATTRPGLMFAHGELGWDQFHTMISRSTTPDIFKMVAKIEEFITMQFNSSRRALSAIGPIGTKRPLDRQKQNDEDEYLWDIKYHRHWQKAFEMIADCKFSMLPSMIPKEGTILGGNISLHGNNMTLACFHGINFRSKSWALFCLNEAFIVFATEAQKTQDGDLHIVQDLKLNIGREAQHTLGKNMASVCKISRGHTMPPTFTSVQEWFHYAFATSEIKDLDNFPTMQRYGVESPKDHRRRRTQDYFHDTEMIFVLPSLEMCLKSIHKQGEYEPQSDDERPVVEVTFVTEFEDHIYVAMDAEVILFLHDLISLYIKEKDKDGRMSYKTDTEKKKVTDPTAALKEDGREFNCKFWKLEPTVRLLHWASKEIDPVGVDYVLQKLGFTHARVTIPKWMQRGFMDPLDKFLSILIEYLITVLREKPKEQTEGES
ncbi:bridge-like lipid transfer protein family member 1 isoform X3 [Mytilus galloprovincialis]|uniref:bridge-like lipid transfer protein family member 1 isoform X3 n=1 Tax=Mytilus galloprovincialis TaxID=29158 RepID=UPI003F7BFAB8